MFSSCSISRLVLPILLLSLLVGGCFPDKQQIVLGTLHGEQVWQGTVYLEGDVTLAEDVSLKIMDILEELGLEIAFPSRTVYLQGEQVDEIPSA